MKRLSNCSNILRGFYRGCGVGAAILACAMSGLAEDSAVRLDPLGWLRQAAGARAEALGGAFTARAGDGTATFWNPARVDSLGPYETQISATALPMLLERQAAYTSYIQKLGAGLGSLGVSWQYLHVGHIEERDADGLQIGSLDDLQNAWTVSYGLALDMEWSLGASCKYYLHQIAGEEGKGAGLDLAAAFHPRGAWLRWEFGAILKELSTGFFWSTGRKEPVFPLMRLGTAYHLLYQQLIASVDLEIPFQQKWVPHAGIEWWPWETAALRSGLDASGWHAGAGFRNGPWQVDYSFSLLFEGLSDEHRFSVMLGI